MRKHSSAELLAASDRFDTPPTCTRCGRAFGEEVIYRRIYALGTGLALAGLCAACDAALPGGGAADIEFRARLERSALASVPAQGRA
jgi:hypothetical protein